MEKTYFISFEGIDACGKDTQIQKLIERVKEDDNYPFGNKYSNIWLTRNPTKITKAGQKISQIIRDRFISGEEAAEYFIEDRIEHSKIIKNFLKYSHVFTSRFDLSTLSYQMTQGVDFQKLYNMHKYGDDDGTLIPDITIVFDIPVDIAMARISNRNSVLECYENIEFQNKVREKLFFCIEEIKKLDNRKIIIVNANQNIVDVSNEMFQKIYDFLEENKTIEE